ncbi:MAG: RNA pseudouridine synthase [Parcubacteria group bacterium]|jgi:23S rRNA pseudouridine1911/1915/1917 synthase
MINIVFQSEDLIAVDKPAGLTVHVGAGAKEETLVDFLKEKFPEIKNVGDDPDVRPGIVHRLDKDTSGIMLVARNQKSFEYLKELFKNRRITKKYLALVYGKMTHAEGKIEGEMGRSRRDFRKQALVRGKIDVRKERYSLSYYKLLQELNENSLLEVSPKTGRMHQIRVHLHSIGHPIVGDKKYTFKKYKNREDIRMFLHASEISLTLQNGEKITLRSELPQEFSGLS